MASASADGIGLGAGCQHDEETLLRELLRDGAADAPAHADRQMLSSTVLPCASKVLRPSDCHLEVAPITTATFLPAVFVL